MLCNCIDTFYGWSDCESIVCTLSTLHSKSQTHLQRFLEFVGCCLPSWWPTSPKCINQPRCELISTDSSRLWLFSRCVMYRIELEPLLDMSKGWEKLPNWPVWQASWPCLYCRQGLAIFLLDLPHEVLLSQQRWSSWPLHFFYRSQENQQMGRRHRCACRGDPADEWRVYFLFISSPCCLHVCPRIQLVVSIQT